MKTRYNAEIVAGALLPEESRIIADLVLRDVSAAEMVHLLRVENVLQKRSPGTAIRKAALIGKRLQLVDRNLLLIIAKGNRTAANQALMVAAIKHSRLLGDFLRRVLKEKLRVFETRLNAADWDAFLAECEQLDESVSGWKTSTRAKLGQVVRKCLVESGYLESSADRSITPVSILPEIRKYLLENRETYVLDCMDIVS